MSTIVHVCEALGGGVLAVISSLASGQVADGHRVVLIASLHRPEITADWCSRLDPRVELIELPMAREVSPLRDLRAVVALRRCFAQLAPDAIHLHSSKAGAVGRIAALATPCRRVVYQPHGISYFRRDISPNKVQVYKTIEKLLARLPGLVVACSQGELESFRGVVPASRAALVPNGVEDIGLAVAPRIGRPPVVGMTGRLMAQKDPGFFLKVAKLVGDRCRFVWLGDGEETWRERFQAARVPVSGWIPFDAIAVELRKLDFYVQTSAWEGMPIAVIEAMAAGLPVLATDIVGNRDLVAGNDVGELVATPEEMAKRLIDLLGDPARAERMALQARLIYEQKFSGSAMLNAYYRLYCLQSAVPGPARINEAVR